MCVCVCVCVCVYNLSEYTYLNVYVCSVCGGEGLDMCLQMLTHTIMVYIEGYHCQMWMFW